MIQHFASILCHQDQILDTYADALVRKIDSRLNRETLPRPDHRLIYGRDVSEFMILKPDRMPRPVCKILPVSFFFNIIPCRKELY